MISNILVLAAQLALASAACPQQMPAACEAKGNCHCADAGSFYFWQCGSEFCNEQCEGCHGSGPSPATPAPTPASPTTVPPVPATTPAPGPVVPTPAPSPTPGKRTSKEAAALLNSRYMAFDENNDNSALGVTISMLNNFNDFNQNLFCSPLMGTQCYKGEADCRMSATLYNHKIVLQADKPNRIKLGLGRPVGIVIDQAKLETSFGKCAYIFDGASFGSYNSGCGEGSGSQDCSSDKSAFHNICPSTGQTCTADDVEVHRRMCSPDGPTAMPSKGTDYQCFFGLPALDWPRAGRANHLRNMAKARAARQVGSDAMGPLIEQWNEVVIDEHIMLPELRKDVASVITAFIYKKSHPFGKAWVTGLREKFSKEYNVAVDRIPIVGVDDTVDFTTTGGPFFADEDGSGSFISIV